MTPYQLVALLLLLLFVGLIYRFTMRAQRAQIPSLRRIDAYERLFSLLAQGAEAGRRLHISLGVGGVTNQSTAETLAGLELCNYLSKQTYAAGNAPLITMADPAVMVIAQDQVRRANRPDYVRPFTPGDEVRWLSTEPAAYAAGSMGVIGVEDPVGNIYLGRFGEEYLLLGEAANRQGGRESTIAGSADPNVLPYIHATSPQGLWGEEIFAAGAYLAKKPSHIGSLLAQDTIRWMIGLVILAAVIIRGAGLFD